MLKVYKCTDGKAISVQIHFTRPFYFYWLKEFKLWWKS